jgi:hypothetical protein
MRSFHPVFIALSALAMLTITCQATPVPSANPAIKFAGSVLVSPASAVAGLELKRQPPLTDVLSLQPMDDAGVAGLFHGRSACGKRGCSKGDQSDAVGELAAGGNAWRVRRGLPSSLGR